MTQIVGPSQPTSYLLMGKINGEPVKAPQKNFFLSHLNKVQGGYGTADCGLWVFNIS